MPHRDLVFLDTETSGLDPLQHEIIELALVRVNPRYEVVLQWEQKFKLLSPDAADPKALEINGYTPEKWADAIEFDEAMCDQVSEFLEGADVVGHNVEFDMGFIKAAFRRAGVDWNWRLGKHRIDTVTLAHEHLIPCGLRSLRLDSIRGFLGLSAEHAHTAMGDVLDCMEVYRTLIRATWVKRVWWTMRNKLRRAS